MCTSLKAVEALLSKNPEEVLIVVEDLAETTATEDIPLLPQDLDTTNNIITEALDLLIQELDEGGEIINATNVRERQIFCKCNYVFSFSLLLYLKHWTISCLRVTRLAFPACKKWVLEVKLFSKMLKAMDCMLQECWSSRWAQGKHWT